MLVDIIKIGILCIFIGGASIPVSFQINSSPVIVWAGNALGSLLSAIVVVYIGDRITNERFKKKVGKHRVGKKIITIFDEGDSNMRVEKAKQSINKRGLKTFSLICPIFPGVAVSTVAVYLLKLDTKTYKKWMFGGVCFVSGLYVFGYWWLFVR